MSEYPNVYYEQLSQMIIKNPSLPLKNGEVCFYQGKAKSFKTVTQIKEMPKKKTSLLLTPWIVGIKRKTQVEVKQENVNEYFNGQLYVTNERIVFNCPVDGFNLSIPAISSVKQYKNGIQVISRNASYNVMTSDVKEVFNIIELMNKAQTL